MMDDVQARREFALSLTGHALDAAVVYALGLALKTEPNLTIALMPDSSTAFLVGDCKGSPFVRSFSEWEIGGRLIERYRISCSWNGNAWASIFRNEHAVGDTPLQSAMRALVTHSLVTEEPIDDFTDMTRNEVLQRVFSLKS